MIEILQANLLAVAELLMVLALILLGTRFVFGYVARLAAWVDSGYRWSEGPVVTGSEGMLQRRAVARTRLDPRGKVRVGGELWHAVAAEPVAEGREVEILAVEGLTLRVMPRREPLDPPPGELSDEVATERQGERRARRAGARQLEAPQGGSARCRRLH